MEACDYRITEGSDYQWQCFGYNAYRLDSWNGDQEGHTLAIVFDTHTQEVYEVEAFDYKRQRAYRMINPAYKAAHDAEVLERAVDDIAWELDDGTPLKFVELEVEEDWIEKARAIVNDEDYDTRVQIPVEFSDDELLKYMKMAHERDITFNQFVEEALRAAIDEFKLRDQVDDMRDEYDFSDGVRGSVATMKAKKKKGK